MDLLRPRLHRLYLPGTPLPPHLRETWLWPCSLAGSTRGCPSRSASRSSASGDARHHDDRRNPWRRRSHRIPRKTSVVGLAALRGRPHSRHFANSRHRLPLGRRSSTMFFRRVLSSGKNKISSRSRANDGRHTMRIAITGGTGYFRRPSAGAPPPSRPHVNLIKTVRGPPAFPLLAFPRAAAAP